MSRVLVTGGNGMMGTDLCRILRERGHAVTVTDKPEMDVRDPALVRRIVDGARPDIVMHLAALTDVDGCEQAPDDAYLTNTLGTQNVALACLAQGADLLYVSTLSVFNGDKGEPYTELDTPDPRSCYSRSKHQGELAVQRLVPRHYIVRAGWVFGGGTRDKKFVAKIIELAGQRPSLKIVDDKFGSPTYTVDISQGMVNLIETKLYGTYHMVNTGPPASRYEVAREVLRCAGITSCELFPVSSDEFPLPAPRPRMEAGRNYQLDLRGLRWMRPWKDAIAEYVRDLVGPEPSRGRQVA